MTAWRPPYSDLNVADIPCDLVVISAGFMPNVEIAADAGIELGRSGAFRTDDRMETTVLRSERGGYSLRPGGDLRRFHAQRGNRRRRGHRTRALRRLPHR